MANKVIIFSAPSGSGKSTIVKHILEVFPQMEFSISATSRKARGNEKHGVEYYFFSKKKIRQMIKDDEFIEYEEVYSGDFYGTLKSEVERIHSKGNIVIFDVDVQGGMNLKEYFKDKALSVFIKAPSLEEIRRRLFQRNTDSIETIEKRLAKAASEMEFAEKFDKILINNDLSMAYNEVELIIRNFLAAQ